MMGYVLVFPLVMTVMSVLSVPDVPICRQEEQVGTLQSYSLGGLYWALEIMTRCIPNCDKFTGFDTRWTGHLYL